ncbi:peroxiredoxin [Parabacteroides sp. PFB2-12]|uniref:AhpC/TSA family protein n=1 Tax=unclassified Parabacteroides TaxID=2649774 RepID=UPI002476059D|nr:MULTISPECIES: AhpC/TSA family protein [unclassified Parabacteroides]MDH6342879.1 peroxiredoxin [Parabacteroides sp. PM6-13]MDH6390491.1 peroxiredoxin [Parabacteroides sp. PFB2-12]
MKKLFIYPIMTLCLLACGERSQYDVKGTVADSKYDGQYVYLYEYGTTRVAPKDSALVEKGKFSMKGKQEIPALYTLRFAENEKSEAQTNTGEVAPFTALFTLQNAKYTIEVNELSTVSGTPENNAFSQLQQELRKVREEMASVTEDMRSDNEDIANRAEERYEQIEAEATALVKTYIDNHPNAPTSAKLLYDFRYDLSEEERREIVSKAGDAFLAVPGIDRIIEHLAILEKVAIGKPFSDFDMADPQGKMRKLSDYAGKGKVVLVDFWASWCPPCRADMPHLVALYKEYANQDFEIVGVSLDRTDEAWKKGIADLHITWPQMSDLKFWHNEAATLYGVNSIPHTVLIDKDGTIIAKNLRGKALEEKLREVLK